MSSKKTGISFIWIFAFVLAFALLFAPSVMHKNERQENFSTFLAHVQDGEVAGVTIRENQLTVVLDDRSVYTAVGVADEDLVRRLSDQGAYVAYEDASSGNLGWWAAILIPIFIILLFVALVARHSKNVAGGVMELGKSRARRIEENDTTFEDVGGLADAKEQFTAVIDFLKHPERWINGGVRLPRGVLLVGPPGCGKTLMARAVAGEAKVPFFCLSASEFVEIFVGVGAARVRDLFDQAKKDAPSLIFIDEIDAIGRRRGSGIGSSHDEREQTLNQLLSALDGLEKNDQVVVIAATNRPDVLDRALLRPGRIDQLIAVDPPDRDARLRMLEIHTRNKSLADEVSLEAIADETEGLSGADLENLTNEAALMAVRSANGGAEAPRVTREHLRQALGSNRSRNQMFNQLDAVLIESASQVAQPTGTVELRLSLRDGTRIEGHLLWADGNFIKVEPKDADEPVVIAKSQIKQVEALAGTAPLAAGEAVGDRWSHRVVDTM